jgi:hypothetical protein
MIFATFFIYLFKTDAKQKTKSVLCLGTRPWQRTALSAAHIRASLDSGCFSSFKFFSNLENFHKVLYQIFIISNIFTLPKGSKEGAPQNMALGVQHLACITFPELSGKAWIAFHVHFGRHHPSSYSEHYSCFMHLMYLML